MQHPLLFCQGKLVELALSAALTNLVSGLDPAEIETTCTPVSMRRLDGSPRRLTGDVVVLYTVVLSVNEDHLDSVGTSTVSRLNAITPDELQSVIISHIPDSQASQRTGLVVKSLTPFNAQIIQSLPSPTPSPMPIPVPSRPPAPSSASPVPAPSFTPISLGDGEASDASRDSVSSFVSVVLFGWSNVALGSLRNFRH